ncbi:MAG: EndoU domain-containing protein [Bradymonadia bacterium]|jgi:hypothetical protein
MGTGKSGRYLNTVGSGTAASEFALVHAVEGKFTKPRKPTDTLRLISGGHGQRNIEILDKYNIAYAIVVTYPNGVRAGHVPRHDKRSKRKDIGQSWFPKSWTDATIKKAGEHVARLKKHKTLKDGQTAYGMYRGVRVGIILTHGMLATIFPDSVQPVYRGRLRRATIKDSNVKQLFKRKGRR